MVAVCISLCTVFIISYAYFWVYSVWYKVCMLLSGVLQLCTCIIYWLETNNVSIVIDYKVHTLQMVLFAHDYVPQNLYNQLLGLH